MADPRRDSRITHGLIPLLVAMRVRAERERKAAEAARKAGSAPAEKPRKKRGWFG